jgi:hypothetical protein
MANQFSLVVIADAWTVSFGIQLFLDVVIVLVLVVSFFVVVSLTSGSQVMPML